MKLGHSAVFLALALAACATTPKPPMETSAEAPGPIDGHDWFLNLNDEQPRLNYGAENSDDLWLMLSCRSGGGPLEVSQPATASGSIQLESGGDMETYPTQSEPSELHDLLLTARASTSDPVFQRFLRVGWLATWIEGRRMTMAPQPGSAQRIASFFAACG